MDENPIMNNDVPVSGDGEITIVTSEMENSKMAIDLPENVATQLQLESIQNGQANNRDGRGVTTAAMGVLQAAMARNFDELGVAESRANSGLIATPVASPATQQ